MENLCSRVSAYLYMGASVQMAFSLGLHRDQIPETGSSIEREQNRRVWWTLFTLDQEISSRSGSPTVIDERYTRVTTPMPSEQVRVIMKDSPAVLTMQGIISWAAHPTLLAGHISIFVPSETGNHSSHLYRAICKLHIFFNSVEFSLATPEMVPPNASASEIRCSYASNAQTRRRQPPPALLEQYHSSHTTLPPLSRHQIQCSCF